MGSQRGALPDESINISESVALPLDQFSLNGKTLVAEASTLQWSRMVRLYDDACDAGIFIRSHKTGKIEAFYHSDTDSDFSGEEIAGWRFKPVNKNLTTITEVLIIND